MMSGVTVAQDESSANHRKRPQRKKLRTDEPAAHLERVLPFRRAEEE
jgi:hypothetical protein